MIDLIYSLKITSKISVLTQKGINEQEEWKGLKKYMEDFSLLNEREIPEIVIWEKFLVYATTFGIADKVLKQIKIVYPNEYQNINASNYVVMYAMLNTNFNSSFSHSINSSINMTYSSGTGGGGGFSGGGGRRSEAGGGGGGR